MRFMLLSEEDIDDFLSRVAPASFVSTWWLTLSTCPVEG